LLTAHIRKTSAKAIGANWLEETRGARVLDWRGRRNTGRLTSASGGANLFTLLRCVRNRWGIRALLLWPRQEPTLNSRRCKPTDDRTPHLPQPRKGLTVAVVGPRQGGDDVVAFRVRKFHLRLLTVLPFGSARESLGRTSPAAPSTPALSPRRDRTSLFRRPS